MQIGFLYPRFLLLLLLIPIFIAVYFLSFLYTKKKAIIFGNFKAIERFYGIEFFSKKFIVLYLNLLILIAMIFALSGVYASFKMTPSAYSYVILIDNSKSMSSTDLLPNRLEAAKRAAKNFVDSMPVGTSVGVIGFSGDAQIYQELDNSKIKTKMAIEGVDFGEVSGTNVYNALIAANKIFGNKKLKAVILLSDGQFNVGNAPQIIDYLKRTNLVVYSVGVGTVSGGETSYNTLSKMDVDFLKALAFNSNGKFFLANETKVLMGTLENLGKSKPIDVRMDLSFYFLIFAIVLFSINWILYNMRFRIFP